MFHFPCNSISAAILFQLSALMVAPRRLYYTDLYMSQPTLEISSFMKWLKTNLHKRIKLSNKTSFMHKLQGQPHRFRKKHTSRKHFREMYTLKPHFYIEKNVVAGVYLFFLFLFQNIDCGYSSEPPRRGGSNEYPQSIYVLEQVYSYDLYRI